VYINLKTKNNIMATFTILEQEEVTNHHKTAQYDENGNEIPGTEVTWTTTTVKTKVEYDFPGYGKHIVDIAHFNPQTTADIELGINNRAITEQKKLGLID
jgi:hypothetical protein